MAMDPRRYVERVKMAVRCAEELRLLGIEVHLSPFYYEQCLIVKKMPHGLGVLSQWGIYYDRRPLKTWRGQLGIYPLHFQTSGISKITAYGADGETGRKEYAISAD